MGGGGAPCVSTRREGGRGGVGVLREITARDTQSVRFCWFLLHKSCAVRARKRGRQESEGGGRAMGGRREFNVELELEVLICYKMLGRESVKLSASLVLEVREIRQTFQHQQKKRGGKKLVPCQLKTGACGSSRPSQVLLVRRRVASP